MSSANGLLVGVLVVVVLLLVTIVVADALRFHRTPEPPSEAEIALRAAEFRQSVERRMTEMGIADPSWKERQEVADADD